jgi:hypothetical protein
VAGGEARKVGHFMSCVDAKIRLKRLLLEGIHLRGSMLGGTMLCETMFVFHQPMLIKMLFKAVARPYASNPRWTGTHSCALVFALYLLAPRLRNQKSRHATQEN